MKKASIYGIVVLAFALAFLCIGVQRSAIKKIKKERDSYMRNTEVLLSDIDTFRTRNGELAARVSDLELNKKDFERLMSEDARRINELKARNEELSRMVKTSTSTVVEIVREVRDTIVFHDGRLDTLKHIEWNDAPWESFSATIDSTGTMRATLAHHDEIDVAVLLEYKRFLWWKTKVKGCSVDVVSHNPYTSNLDVSSVCIR